MGSMSISPFSVRPVSPESDRRRARLVLAIATIGIAATLLAYAVSPGVRHAVGHAAHSVKGAVGHVLDRDKTSKKASPAATQTTPAKTTAGKTTPAKAKAKATTTPTSTTGQPAGG